MAATLEEVAQELKETNSVMVDVQQNTELTSNYLDLTVDTLSLRFDQLTNAVQGIMSPTTGNDFTNVFSDKLDQLLDVIQRDVNTTQNIASDESNRDRNLFESLQVTFSDKLDELISFMRGVQKEEKKDSLDVLERRREEGQDDKIGQVKTDDYVQDFLEKVTEFAEQLLRVIGAVVGIIVAPFVIIGAFFKELGAQVAILDRLLRGGLSRFFSPITNLFNAIRESRAVQSVTGLWRNSVVPFFARIGEFLGLVEKGDDGIRRATGIFAKIVNTAARLGTFLARLNPVILSLVGAFQFVTGFMEGFNRDGVIEGLKQGVVDAFDAILGGLVRLVGDVAGFLFGLIGFDNFGESLSNLTDTLVDSVITSFESIVDMIVGLFTLDFEKVKNASIAGGDAIINLVTSVVDTIYGFIKDIFSFVGIELPEFDFGQFIRDTLSSIEDFFKGFISGLNPFSNNDNDSEEDETKSGGGGFLSRLNPLSSEDDKEEVSAGSTPAGVATGNELQMEGEARRDAELEMSQLGRVGGPGSNAVNVSTNVQNNSNTTTQTRPPAASQPDNMSDTMLTAGFAP